MAELTTLARPYAKAVFEMAGDGTARERWSERLALLDGLVRHEDMQRVIRNPSVSAEVVVDLVRELAGDDLGEEGLNFVRLLARNRRLTVVPEIRELYEQLRAEAENAIDVTVVAASALTDEQQRRIAEALGKRLGREVRLHHEVDESVLGGAVIRAGDLVIDGSAAGRLGKLSTALVH